MAYLFSAEKHGTPDLRAVHRFLTQFDLFEFFPIEISEELLTLGISIPFKSVDDLRFKNDLEEVMTFLVSKEDFNVIDLFTGNRILTDHIPGLAKQISN